ncbi:thioesterase family protein [Nocardioides sambongensis]|uniref:thioesterase family protein n=1 Tax=Nocardioides sambongensis TaxID=2589074 RepID=UPI00112E3D1C|nr:thioesterase family protein [Nocardioides sambongensis]
MPYFERLDEQTWGPTEHVGGAWNTAEQHIAPALGLLAHLVELDQAQRREERLPLARISYDILGVVPVEPCTTQVRVLRPGRTVELVEAALRHGGRDVVLARAWMVAEGETAQLAATDLPALPAPEELPAWPARDVWPGGFIASVQVRRAQEHPGRARFWVRTDVPLVDEQHSAVAAFLGLADIANGMTVRADPRAVLFPNVDLTAHLFREPEPGWVGFDTTVSFGPGGHGLTSSVLHDVHGPVGTVAQSLTVRPLG